MAAGAPKGLGEGKNSVVQNNPCTLHREGESKGWEGVWIQEG